MKVKFIINGTPQGKGRHRSTVIKGKIHNYTPEKTSEYEERVQIMYLAAGGWRLYGPICATIKAYYKIPQSWAKKRRADACKGTQRPQTKPDCDNIAKIILDALNGRAYDDDKQVTGLNVEKHYTDGAARVEVTLEEITEGGNGKED